MFGAPDVIPALKERKKDVLIEHGPRSKIRASSNTGNS